MFEILVGLRYVCASRKQGFMSFMAGASIIGIALGVAVLIVVLSVLNGFKTNLTGFMEHSSTHVEISGPASNRKLDDWKALLEQAKQQPYVRYAEPYIRQPVTLNVDGKLNMAFLKGVSSSNFLKNTPGKAARFDTLVPGKYFMEVAYTQAMVSHIQVGDQVPVLTLNNEATVAGVMPRYRMFTVTKVLLPQVGSSPGDEFQVYVALEDAQALFRMGSAISTIGVTLTTPMEAPAWKTRWEKLHPEVITADWTADFADLFKMLNLQKRISGLILFLLVVVATFNLVASLMMTVSARKPEIAILRTMGSTPGSIWLIFLTLGGVIGALGALLGVAIGIPAAMHIGSIVNKLDSTFSAELSGALGVFSQQLPSEILTSDVVTVALGAICLSLLATVYPSWKASRVAPAEALR